MPQWGHDMWLVVQNLGAPALAVSSTIEYGEARTCSGQQGSSQPPIGRRPAPLFVLVQLLLRLIEEAQRTTVWCAEQRAARARRVVLDAVEELSDDLLVGEVEGRLLDRRTNDVPWWRGTVARGASKRVGGHALRQWAQVPVPRCCLRLHALVYR